MVTLWLAGVRGAAGELAVSPSTELWFSHYTISAQLLDLLERVDKHLDPEPRG